MSRSSYIFLLCALPALSCMPPEPECGIATNGSVVLNLSVRHTKNGTGHWITTGSACRNSENSKMRMDLDIKRRVVDCGGGRYTVHIQGILTEDPDSYAVERLRFHPRHGKNAALANDRRTAYRISENENHGAVYTDRPVRRNELFEVSLDKINPKQPYNLGIGVTTHTPYEEDASDELLHLVSGMWLYYHTHVHINGRLVLHRYGIDLDDSNKFKLGDRVGVLVKDTGILHYYVNGVDQGPADSNIPNTVYGVIELRSKTVRVTITS